MELKGKATLFINGEKLGEIVDCPFVPDNEIKITEDIVMPKEVKLSCTYQLSDAEFFEVERQLDNAFDLTPALKP